MRRAFLQRMNELWREERRTLEEKTANIDQQIKKLKQEAAEDGVQLRPSMSVEEIRNLPLKAFSQVTTEIINQLNYEQLKAFTKEQIDSLPPGSLSEYNRRVLVFVNMEIAELKQQLKRKKEAMIEFMTKEFKHLAP